MADQTAYGLSTISFDAKDIDIPKFDSAILRELAAKVADFSSHPKEQEKAKLWTDHNDLEATRPLIFCDPENGWNEIIPEADLQCTSPLGKTWEMKLIKEVVWATDMDDDRVCLNSFDIPYVAVESDWGMRENKIGGANAGAYTWEAPLKDYNDLELLKFPRINVDHESTKQLKALADEKLGDFFHVRTSHQWWWSLGLTYTLVNLRGIAQSMLDMYDHPRELHKLMAFIRDGHLSKLKFLESNGLLADNTGGTYVGSGGFGWTNELPKEGFNPAKVRLEDMWGFAESQETTSVSPQMFAEFVLPYQMPILEQFGLNCYGCCEPLDKRWEYIKHIPRLRRVSVSPWANIDDMAAMLGSDYIYSYKPNPAHLAVAHMDEDLVRNELRSVIKRTKGCRLEIIMKDNNTLGNNPKNAYKWVQIAKQEAMNA